MKMHLITACAVLLCTVQVFAQTEYPFQDTKLSEEERLTAERRLRRRRRIVFCLVSAAAILVIALAVIFGRG